MLELWRSEYRTRIGPLCDCLYHRETFFECYGTFSFTCYLQNINTFIKNSPTASNDILLKAPSEEISLNLSNSPPKKNAPISAAPGGGGGGSGLGSGRFALLAQKIWAINLV